MKNKMKFILASLAIVTFATYANSDGGLDVVNDDKLVNKIKSDDFVAVLFSEYSVYRQPALCDEAIKANHRESIFSTNLLHSETTMPRM